MSFPDNFIKARIADDLERGVVDHVVVRFPPEPNGYLHLGHAKSILLNRDIAEHFKGEINLRFDDTNPEKETEEYVEAIKRDAAWLNPHWSSVRWASDYFPVFYECAELLINKGLAYVDDSSVEEIRALRGDFTKPGTPSIYRSRSVEENLELFRKMKAGEFGDGAKVLRAKIDLSSPNINLRDPVLYRIRHASHHNTGDAWCIYPMYDFAHPLEDAIEGVTHSLCTLEFEDHRPLYDWCVDRCLEVVKHRPVELEFARLDVRGVTLSKRKLSDLVYTGKVARWDSPEMPTIAGLRNRGMTPEILHDFIGRCGVSKANSVVDDEVLNESVREVLGPLVHRRMAVVDPVPLWITNMTHSLEVEAPNHPKEKEMGKRLLNLGSKIWVERSDVRSVAEEGFWRIVPGNWIRLKYAANILIERVETDEAGHITGVFGVMDEESRDPKKAKVKAKAAIHWVDASSSIECNFKVYHDLFLETGEFNPNCVETLTGVREPECNKNVHYELERNGFFYVEESGVFNGLAWLKNKR